MLDTLDDVFRMLPFSSKKQAQIIRQENQISDEEWEKRRELIMAEHRLPNSKEQLEQHWKAWIAQNAFSARRAAATRAKAAAAQIPEYDTKQCTTLPPASIHSARSNRHTGCPGQAMQFLAAGHKFRIGFL